MEWRTDEFKSVRKTFTLHRGNKRFIRGHRVRMVPIPAESNRINFVLLEIIDI